MGESSVSALSVMSSQPVPSGHYAIRINVEREATLTDNLDAIESRETRGLYLEVGSGYTRLSVEAAEVLRFALADAICLARAVPDIEQP